MKEYEIWMEDHTTTHTYYGAELLANIEGDSFIDAVMKWYGSTPEIKEKYGELKISNGIPCLGEYRLYSNCYDANKLQNRQLWES